jgi:hypothetical protein
MRWHPSFASKIADMPVNETTKLIARVVNIRLCCHPPATLNGV